ncbi:g-type lectin s-receptor-like serine/threonine-protein kinase rlk1 [Phtheirospermum japonicum]|uniref:non-specific serine/threonine protein kinase n=1 Tax=Phtheirospermum japonicum TaxID=374723 RepID=A0A830B787_9LAMI|nr:g-type lectin s-receptor-like serine/threonine-protein kinase rlk1 [Phtheirospermum japonicum]
MSRSYEPIVKSAQSGRVDHVNAYWSTQTSIGAGYRVIFNQSGYIYLTARNGTVLNDIFTNEVSTTQFHQRLTLDYDGVLRHYLYPRSANSTGGRPMSWSINDFEPSNICLRTGGETGGGACGFNSLCSLEGNDQRPICECPNKYSKMDPTDRMGGCKPDFLQQSCDQNSRDSDNFELISMSNTNWPNGDYYIYESVSEEFCRQSCLDDCLCYAVFIRGDGMCWKKGFPLRNGRVNSSIGGKSLVKIRLSNNTRTDPFGGNSNKSSRSSNRAGLIITGWALFGGSVFLNLLLFASFMFKGEKSEMNVHAHALLPGVNIRSFGFNELREATNGFSEELGSGACSKVYKGSLKDENGKIAVKKLDKLEKEADLEFKAEVSSISRTNHKNLVQLLGYCDEGQNRLLVYEFMQNGSLASFLFGKSPKPNWYRRVQIAFEVARGLCYLHEECTMQIIHCDIKPQNVLLDSSHVAKISDFGLAKLLKPDQTRTNTGIRGTRGYVAPEWFRNMPITAKVDVYSFGILLLELLCCRKNYETEVENESEVILADWAYDCYAEGTLGALVAGDEVALDDIRRFEKFVMTAIWCVQEDPALRPQMKRVLHMLEGSVEVPAPPDPTSFIN